MALNERKTRVCDTGLNPEYYRRQFICLRNLAPGNLCEGFAICNDHNDNDYNDELFFLFLTSLMSKMSQEDLWIFHISLTLSCASHTKTNNFLLIMLMPIMSYAWKKKQVQLFHHLTSTLNDYDYDDDDVLIKGAIWMHGVKLFGSSYEEIFLPIKKKWKCNPH